MKRHLAIGLLLLLALAACQGRYDDPVETQDFASLQPIVSEELQAVDSLMWQRPDSALALLLPWFDTCGDAMLASPKDPAGETALETHSMRLYNRHYAHLLLAELLYKNDYAQTNREALLAAVAYFDSLVRQAPPLKGGRGDSRHVLDQKGNPAFLSARAHYINGVGYYEQDSVVEACREYIKALEIMESRFDEKELIGEKLRFMALTYTRLVDLFSDQYLHEQAICFSRFALSYYQKQENPTWFIARMLCEIGMHYDMMKQLDSAEYYYNKASVSINDTNVLMYRDVSALLVYLSYKKDKDPSSLNQLKRLLLKAENKKEYYARCAVIGDIFYHEKQFDSAQRYFYIVFQNTSDEDLRRQVSKQMVDILKARGRDTEIFEYAEFLAPFATLDEDISTAKSQLEEIYNRYRLQELEQQHKQNMMGLAKNLIVVISVLLVMAFGFFVLFWRNKRKKKSLETQIKDERYAHKIKQKALSSRLKMSNEILRQTFQQLEEVKFSKNIDTDGKNTKTNMTAFKSSPICQHIMEVVEDRNFKPKVEHYIYKDYALDRSQLKDLMEAADQHLNDFTLRIRKKYPSLTDDDMKYCCLYLLGLNEADISALMQRAYSTVCDRNRKIKRIIGTKGELVVALMDWV